jgi:hypothetical protein
VGLKRALAVFFIGASLWIAWGILLSLIVLAKRNLRLDLAGRCSAASICTGKKSDAISYKDELRAFRVHRPLDGVLNKFSRISQR